MPLVLSAEIRQAEYQAKREQRTEQWFKDNPQLTKEGLKAEGIE